MQENKAAGFLELEQARVRWFLSLDYNDIPEEVKKRGLRTFRTLTINDENIEFKIGRASCRERV